MKNQTIQKKTMQEVYTIMSSNLEAPSFRTIYLEHLQDDSQNPITEFTNFSNELKKHLDTNTFSELEEAPSFAIYNFQMAVAVEAMEFTKNILGNGNASNQLFI